MAFTLAQNDMCPQFCVLQFVSLQVGVHNSTKKRSDSVKDLESNAHLIMCLSATDSKKSSFFYFSLARAYRYERNLAGVGIDAGRVSIFPDHQNRAREKEGREREFCRRIKRSKIGNGKKHYYTVLNGLKMLI